MTITDLVTLPACGYAGFSGVILGFLVFGFHLGQSLGFFN
jgi:hypothetical protein